MTQPPTPSRTHNATVTAVTALTSRTTRTTLAAPTFVGLHTRPAQDVEVLLTDRHGRYVKRRYTIGHCRPDAGEIDLDIFVHQHGGPGSSWARTAQPGTTVDLIGPKGKLELLPADWHLFVGDEASLPAIAALTESLGPHQITTVLAEVTDNADEIPISATQVQWIRRGNAPAGTPDLLIDELRNVYQPDGIGRAYLLGESRTMIALRKHLDQHGIDTEHTFLKGYWNR